MLKGETGNGGERSEALDVKGRVRRNVPHRAKSIMRNLVCKSRKKDEAVRGGESSAREGDETEKGASAQRDEGEKRGRKGEGKCA